MAELTDEVTVHHEEGCLVYEIDLPEDVEQSILGRLLKLAAGGVQFFFKLIGRDDP